MELHCPALNGSSGGYGDGLSLPVPGDDLELTVVSKRSRVGRERLEAGVAGVVTLGCGSCCSGSGLAPA